VRKLVTGLGALAAAFAFSPIASASTAADVDITHPLDGSVIYIGDRDVTIEVAVNWVQDPQSFVVRMTNDQGYVFERSTGLFGGAGYTVPYRVSWGVYGLYDGHYSITVTGRETGIVEATAEFDVDVYWIPNFWRRPKVFSPNGDGIADSTFMGWQQNKPMDARVAIRGGHRLVRKWLFDDAVGSLRIRWFGKDAQGQVVPPGRYTIKLTQSRPPDATDGHPDTVYIVRKPVWVT
jgi:hypothetical protein